MGARKTSETTMSKKSERIEVAPDCFVVSARGPSLSGNSMSDTVADIVASTRRQVNDLEKLAEKLREINFTTTIRSCTID